MQSSIDKEKLIEQLRSVAMSKQPSRAKLPQLIASGTASTELLRHYAAQLWSLAAGFSNRLAKVWSVCDDTAVRASLLQNMLEEEGVVSFRTSELILDPQRHHGALAGRFAQALGVNEKPTLQRQDWLDTALAAGAWRSAYAFMAVGHEYNVPATIQAMCPGLRTHYGLTEHELEFLTLHGEADCRHGEEAIVLLAQSCQTEEHVAHALQGARKGTINFYLLHQLDNDSELRLCA
jgi:pyrroloquinoline-quinone synthase